jgi:hypothetical protein
VDEDHARRLGGGQVDDGETADREDDNPDRDAGQQ